MDRNKAGMILNRAVIQQKSLVSDDGLRCLYWQISGKYNIVGVKTCLQNIKS